MITLIRSLTLASLIVLAGFVLAQELNLDDTTFAEIDALVGDMMESRHLPGVAVGISKDGEQLYARGFGVHQVGSDTAVTPQSVFLLSSITKSVTATAIMQLVDRGLIELDASLTTYLPEFRFDDERSTDITVRQVLSHMSGMPEGADEPSVDAPAEYDDAALARYVSSQSEFRLARAPGLMFEYSNIGFDVLGAVVASVSNQSYESYIQENIFAPLGMTSSTMRYQETDAELLALPHVPGTDGPEVLTSFFPYTRTHTPSNGLFTTIEDMTVFGSALLNGGELGGVRILEAGSVEQMWTPVTITGWERYVGSYTRQYGLGWNIGTDGDLRTVGHLGFNSGYSSVVSLYPDEGVMVIVLANYQEDTPAWELRDRIVGILNN